MLGVRHVYGPSSRSELLFSKLTDEMEQNDQRSWQQSRPDTLRTQRRALNESRHRREEEVLFMDVLQRKKHTMLKKVRTNSWIHRLTPKGNGVYSGSRSILGPSFVEM